VEMLLPAILSGLLMGMLFALVALGLAIIFGALTLRQLMTLQLMRNPKATPMALSMYLSMGSWLSIIKALRAIYLVEY